MKNKSDGTSSVIYKKTITGTGGESDDFEE